ncbi:hypothetical protein QBC39DRAFT_334173 [Podospora conica]|nr:hypothetical protein QBC39DRAFT_334173 [Schizothecium conicum]
MSSDAPDITLDPEVQRALPDVVEILEAKYHPPNSPWATFFRILARKQDGNEETYFMKFGLHCTTYIGDIPQDNTWSSSWEEFFARGLRRVLAVREDRAGPDAELESVLATLFDKVIPRLLRPLESDEFGNRRPEPNKFGPEYLEMYHEHIPKSEPREDYDDRNALYAVRFKLHAAALFPNESGFLQMLA